MIDQQIVHIALIVRDYDQAIDFYVNKLNFKLLEDTTLSETKRWILLTPPGKGNCSLLLAKGVGEDQRSRIGNQTGGRVFLFLKTDDFWRDYTNMVNNGVMFTKVPKKEVYGIVAVFSDLYGNLWDLVEFTKR